MANQRLALVRVGLALAAASILGAAAQQPEKSRPPEPSGQPDDGHPIGRGHPPMDRDFTRGMVQRGLARTRDIEEQLEDVAKRLSAGEDLVAVRRDLQPLIDRYGAIMDERSAETGGDVAPELRREQVLGFLREHFPSMGQRLEEIEQTDAKGGERAISRFWPRIAEMEGVKRRDPELFALRLDEMKSGFAVMESTRTYRAAKKASPADEAKIAIAREAVRTTLTSQFDIRARLQEREIKKLGERLDDLNREFQARSASRERVIEEELGRFLERSERPESSRRRGPPGPDASQPADAAPPR